MFEHLSRIKHGLLWEQPIHSIVDMTPTPRSAWLIDASMYGLTLTIIAWVSDLAPFCYNVVGIRYRYDCMYAFYFRMIRLFSLYGWWLMQALENIARSTCVLIQLADSKWGVAFLLFNIKNLLYSDHCYFYMEETKVQIDLSTYYKNHRQPRIHIDGRKQYCPSSSFEIVILFSDHM